MEASVSSTESNIECGILDRERRADHVDSAFSLTRNTPIPALPIERLSDSLNGLYTVDRGLRYEAILRAM
jgi:hypothetical protein